ncbi:substrate-binding periplasmic protein [Shewanella psychrotolerans]|uniref:substrate-binding periplasmic protein n=1 Tax=Shewanella psychrotolerans TaxID=2864206 RepID=UPI001C658ECD|nr:transporter substrate-binding domain-containing protein [Shewanella psychrotolerans]QYK00519.1 transporter substrate-binding domain-containing protein [Shewanella psychrotolerans]
MHRYFRFLLLICIFLFPIHHVYSESIRLFTNISPPYQIKDKNGLSGTSIDALKCIFVKMNYSYELETYPWKRIHFNIKAGKGDGFFSAIPHPKIENYATLSSPIALEKWYWYYNGDSLKNDYIGVIRGSPQDIWFEQSYKNANIHRVERVEQLIKLLDNKRVSAVLVDQKTFKNTMISLGRQAHDFGVQFEKYTPLGFYFTDNYLKEHPSFLKLFNQHLSSCVTNVIHLSQGDRQIIQNIAETKIRKWMYDPIVIQTLESQNNRHKSLTSSDIQQLDKRWRYTSESIDKTLADQILQNPLSQFLKDKVENSNGLYDEIFVMDSMGLIAGKNAMTSDYWQGDEAKYINTYLQGKDAVFIDEIQYDDSAKKFQSQVSLTIHDPKTLIPIGVITVGVDVEKALVRGARN